MRLLASARVLSSDCQLLAAFFLPVMLIAPAVAETAPSVSKHAIQASEPTKQDEKAVEPAAHKVLIVIDKPTQEMQVLVDDVERYTWAVSTGIRRYDTPSGTYTARSMNEMWYSKQWDDAPMPHAIFFTRKGHAIHGTEETKKLGRPASHGCVRLARENARTLFALVKEKGLKNTEVVLNGDIPSPELKVASHGPRKQQIKSRKKTVAVLKRASPAKSRVASSGARKLVLTGGPMGGSAKMTGSRLRHQDIKASKKVVYRYYDPGELEDLRRLSRKEWRQLYYTAPPQRSLPKGRYELAPDRRRSLRRY
jgi:L,D-transpeptidase catalytic domain